MANTEQLSLLPANASKLECLVEQLIAEEFNIPINLTELWQPDSCPLELLPWLASALSVDYWDDEWVDSVNFRERMEEVINKSVSVHQHKGTVQAIKEALQTLDIEVEVAEWWHEGQNGAPHTFKLNLQMFDNLNNQNFSEENFIEIVTHKLSRVIDATKPARCHYEFKIGAGIEVFGGIGAKASIFNFNQNAGQFVQLPCVQAESGLAGTLINRNLFQTSGQLLSCPIVTTTAAGAVHFYVTNLTSVSMQLID